MKLLSYLFASALWVLVGSGAVRAQSSVQPPDQPTLLVPGTVLRIIDDSVYLVSKERYRFYQKAHYYLVDSTAGNTSVLIASYEEALQETQRAYDSLLQQYRAADSVAIESMHHTQFSLGQVKRTLDHAHYNLGQTTSTLAEVEAQLVREQRRSFFRRLAYGAGGVGVGMILMSLLTR